MGSRTRPNRRLVSSRVGEAEAEDILQDVLVRALSASTP
jgi:DNA-directed RNA polymerase specialized sigma24 family protein